LISELANERFILNERNHSPITFDKVITLCGEAGFSPRIGAAATNGAGVVALVGSGEGVAVLSQGGAGMKWCSFRLVFLDVVIAWAPQYESPVLRSFLEFALKKRRRP
jgi:DNA-binding transcriptional LysR family regulator